MTRFLNALWIYVLSGILLGAYIYQDVEREIPCSLCMLQRLAMICIAIGPMLNLRIKFSPLHYGISLLGCIFGSAVSLRQISLHVCPGFPTFGVQVLGFELYTWAFLVFAFSLIGMALLLFLYKEEEEKSLNIFEKGAFLFIFLITLSNCITTLFECGLSACE